ncbi:RICIN domain-containing protein [Actinoplanes sp. NPDC051475]|uniref:RICIN domain-containing protein n=1 Tax=Actinoplanes sp. NPDC051475 TaxID=3157225 RepID=UPI00344BA08A
MVAGNGPANAAATQWSIHAKMDGAPTDPYATRCAEVAGASTANSAQTQMYGCRTHTTHQRWYFDLLPNGINYRLRNVKSGKCMNVKGASKLEGAKVIQYTCGNADTYNDQWRPLKVSSLGGYDYYQLMNRNSTLCLTVQGGSSADGADLIQGNCGTFPSSSNSFTWRSTV